MATKRRRPSEAGRKRVVIEHVGPEVDDGRFPAKRVVGDEVRVEASVFADGHDEVRCVLRHRPAGGRWQEIPMAPLGNDRWAACFVAEHVGMHRFRVVGWVDHFLTWVHDLRTRVDAGQDVAVDLRIGAGLVREAQERTRGRNAKILGRHAERLEQGDVEAAFQPALRELMDRFANRRLATRQTRESRITVDRERARYSTWYELFPRSASPEPHRHGTFQDVERLLPRIADMGFDIVYLPPIHPIGRAFRKGPNNSVVCGPDDVGSPWAIGSEEGGHKAIHPALGTLKDFRHLVRAARRLDMEIALDIAFQASPDHPWVREHPEWFRHRPDGTVQYAENPPKKYQDIYPLNFETDAWESLWKELKSVFEHWIRQGVRTFRVDNPHTKAFAFWEWAIAELKRADPDLIFLSEAFTRPHVMYRLAKLGFTQSYTYFAWRNEAWELKEYFTELTTSPVRDFFRPNLWPNTPDILTEVLQKGGRAASAMRLVMAATLGASYGIFGPAFEVVDNRPLEPGREEYLDSEKYQIRHWDLDAPGNLRELITRVNRARREHPALQQDWALRFLRTDNERLLAYAKVAGADVVVTVVNLDPHWTQSGWVEVPAATEPGPAFQVDDVLSDRSFEWRGDQWNYVELDPAVQPAHVLHVHRELRP